MGYEKRHPVRLRAMAMACVCVVVMSWSVPLVSGTPTADCSESEILEDEELARELARELSDMINEHNRYGLLYQLKLVEHVISFHRFGTGVADNPGCSIVTRDVCREAALHLLQKMVRADGPPGSSEPLGRFDNEAAAFLRESLARMLRSAEVDLSNYQRELLGEMADKVLAGACTLAEAGTKARNFLAEARRIDGEQGTYSEEFVTRLVHFYEYGVGTAEEPGDAVVTQKFCREFVIAMCWDLLLVKVENGKQLSSEDEFPHPLDERSARRFRRLVTVLLYTAPEKLDFVQRSRVYRLADEVLTAEDILNYPDAAHAPHRLTELLSNSAISEEERSLLAWSIAKILHQ